MNKPYPEIARIASGPVVSELKAGFGPMGVLLATTVSTTEQVFDSYGFIFPPANAGYDWILDGRRFKFDHDSPACMVVRNPGQASRYDRDGPCLPTLKVAVQSSYLEALAEEVFGASRIEVPPRVFRPTGVLLHAVRLFLDEAGQDSNDNRVVTENLIPIISVGILRACLPSQNRDSTIRSPHPGILRARRLIRDNYNESLSIRDLAATAGLSQSHFMVLFKQATGHSPHEYLRRVRIRAAMKQLAEGVDVTKTCFAVGFNSMSGFEEAFRALVGSTPIEYRRIARSNR